MSQLSSCVRHFSTFFILNFLALVILIDRGSANDVPKLVRCCDVLSNTCSGSDAGVCVLLNINEEIPVDTVIANFTARDTDEVTFSITAGADAITYFKMVRVSNMTSNLVIKNRIDSEALSTSVIQMSYEYKDPINSATSRQINIKIQDINDNNPDFINLPYRCTINENVEKMNCTGIRIWDKDDNTAMPVLTATGTNFPSSLYKFVQAGPQTFPGKGIQWSFNMEIQKKLDYEKDRIFQIKLFARDAANRNATADMVLYVQDEPDQPPVFLRQPYDRSLAENSVAGTNVVQIFARDGDSGINNPITYRLESGNKFNEFFNLNNVTGELTVAKPIDRESSDVRAAFSFIELKVIAEEVRSTPQLANLSQSVVVVHLTITDENDYKPTFGASSYTGVLAENTQKGVSFPVIPEITCEDLDSVANAKFNLSVMKDGSPYDVFYVTPATVVQLATVRLRVNKPEVLDFEKVKQLSFQIVAQEMASPFANTSVDVTVNLTDANDHFPVFNKTQYIFQIPENSAINTPVGNVTAYDGDSGSLGEITYTLEGSSKFYINNQTGEIFVAVDGAADHTLLDRDNFGGAIYSMNVKAQDGGNLAGYTQVQIHLTDKNDKTPVFLPQDKYYALLIEDKTTFQRDVTVSASDQDAPPNNNVTYSIIAGDYGSNFAIDPISGVLSVQKAVDLEKLPPEMNNSNIFTLTVEARDRGVPSLASNATVFVTVEDINDNYPNFSDPIYSVSIRETTAPKTEVLQVKATDADRSGPVFYRIESGAADKFAINGVTGWISVEDRAKLDVMLYNVTVVAIDRGSPSKSSTAIARINVTDVNNQPPSFPAATYTRVVEENNEAGSELFSYPATDPDNNANLVYSILKDEMSAKHGSTPIARSIYIDMFTVTNKGAIVANSVLNREVVETIVLPILVNDTNAEITVPPQTATTVITIVVSDLNDEAPRFQFPNGSTSFTLRVLESLAPPADTSLTVQAVDRDKNDVIRYALQDPTAHFTISATTGVIRLEKALDYETNKTIEMKVFAIDLQGHAINASVLVNVVDTNDNNPVFTVFNSPAYVSEGESVGYVVTTVTAEDKDSGMFGSVSYYLTNDGGGKFQIDNRTGAISVASELDRDVTGGTSYRLAVEARDNVGGTSYQGKNSRLMEVIVNDVNDNAPTFPRPAYNFSDLKENAGVGVKIDEIAAVDKDTDNNSKITYTMVAPESGDAMALSLFQVTTLKDSSSYRAVIRTQKSLKNAVGCHQAILVAEDSGTPRMNGTARLTFCVLDVNDFTPVFEEPSGNGTTTLQLQEMTVNVTLITVRAKDTDKGPNGDVRYRLASSSGDHENFEIDPVTGELKNKRGLDREAKQSYRFQVMAYDLGIPSLSSSVTLLVEIVDVDDHVPTFPSSVKLQSLSVPENGALDVEVKPGVRGRYIGNVSKAADADTGTNAIICYFIVSENVTNLFYLNKRTGGLYAISVFDRETAGEYTLVIKAVGQAFCDSDDYVWQSSHSRRRLLWLTSPIAYSPTDPSLSQVTVKVADVNDNPPTFDRKFFFDGVTKDSPPSTEIIDFKNFVTDIDAGNNSKLLFSIIGQMEITDPLKRQLEEKGLKDVLVVNQTSGVLSTGKRIYFQENMQGYFRFTVSVSDGLGSDTANVTVYLLNQIQRVVVIFRESPANVGKFKKAFADYMSSITGLTVNVDNIVTHKNANGQADSSMTDMYIHAYDPQTHRIIPATELITLLDTKWESLRILYNQYNVLQVKKAVPDTSPTNQVEIFRIILIIVACVLGLLILITCISMWTCRRMYRRKLKAATTVAFGAENGYVHSTPMPGTNRYTYEGSNPIWMAQYDNYAMKDDIPSEKDRDSLDENAITKQKSPDLFDEQEAVLNLNAESDSESSHPPTSTNDTNELLDAAINRRDMLKSADQNFSDQMSSPELVHPVAVNGNLPSTAI